MNNHFKLNHAAEYDEELLHVAIIMDGNGRWAQQRGKPRFWGHRQGAETAKKIIEAAPKYGISTLTLYAFSSDNWKRPRQEVSMLMQLLQSKLQTEVRTSIENGVRISFIGRRDRLDSRLVAQMEKAEADTSFGQNLHLRLAIDYSARDAMLKAAQLAANEEDLTREKFSEYLAQAMNCSEISPDVDLLIRTGGEQRLSDFLLWECAYAELYFTNVMWPDFNEEELARAVETFHSRERRFGAVPQARVSVV
ncbi:MAG: di-trans,poly-cis-decaprenylcistransferase [Calditrichaeota bacterium]|nr:di-trans,poly-cis-decaprenylcistransferase [Calditrichota bacterium]